MIAIIDYQMGNLRSVQKAFLEVGGRAIVTSSKTKLAKADKVVLPGVGAFGDGIKELRKLGLIDVIKHAIFKGKPFFGICLGMHLLFEESEEAPGVKGLGILRGKVKKFSFSKRYTLYAKRYKIPHMGWNQINIKYQISNIKNRLLKNIADDSYVYFVHSYYVAPRQKSIIVATTDYGVKFASAICKDNIHGVQFHPEKSQEIGLEIIKNFVRLC